MIGLRLLLVCLLGAGLTACTSSGPAAVTPSVETITRTQTHTVAAPQPTFTPAAARTVAPLVSGANPARGEVEKACPYIRSSQEEGPKSMADLEGDRIYRTTVLTTTTPVGCRFYFWAPPYEATADIVPRTFASASAARQAMILTGRAGTEVMGQAAIVPGVDAVLYRTKFFGPDKGRDWACAFAKGRLMVIVHTQRDDTSFSARQIAQAIAPKF